jgi:predicted transposase YdaD
LVVLHRGADSPQLTGLYERGFPGEPFDVALRYRVLRVWQVAAQEWLSGGLGLVPLAPLGDMRQQDLPEVIARMKQRLDREAPPGQAADLWSATYILMGLRYEDALVQSLLQGVLTMKESVTYQAIIREGEAKEARKMILIQGRDQFGEPSVEAEAALNALSEVSQLERLGLRLLRVSSWEELLGLNGPGRRGRGRKKKE